MSDLATSRIPRETLAGLLADQRDRITAPMPIVQLDELLGKDSQPAFALASDAELVVRFKTATATSKHVILWSFVLTLLIGALVLVLV